MYIRYSIIMSWLQSVMHTTRNFTWSGTCCTPWDTCRINHMVSTVFSNNNINIPCTRSVKHLVLQLDPGQQNSISKHNQTAQQYLTTFGKTVGVTGKISKWQPEKRAPKKCFHRSFSKMQVFHRHRSTDWHQWELSLLFVDCSD